MTSMEQRTSRRAKVAHVLLDTLLAEQGLRNDYYLARFLDVAPSTLAKIRRAAAHGGVYPSSTYGYRVTGDLILAIYDKTAMPIERIRALAAMGHPKAPETVDPSVPAARAMHDLILAARSR